MNSGIPNLYSDNKSIFLDFINKTNQKDIIVDTMVDIIFQWNFSQKIVITDIGAGSWYIASNILASIHARWMYEYFYNEPSADLVEEFKKNSSHESVIFLNDRIENIDIPKSNYIIASFVFQAIPDKLRILKKMYDALLPWGVICIVNQNIETIDFSLKSLLWYSYSYITPTLVSHLDTLSIPYEKEVKESIFTGVSDILSLNEDGKNSLSFLLFRNFESISKNDQDEALYYIREKAINDSLIRKEDYIFIRK